MFSLPAIEEKNLKKFILLSVTAVLFHYSALILLPLYFLRKDKIQKIYYFLIPIAYILYYSNINVISLIDIFNIEIFSNKIEYHVKYASMHRVNVYNLWQLAHIFMSYLYMWKWKILYGKNRFAVLLVKMNVLSIFAFVVLGDLPSFAFRISELLAVADIVSITFILYLFKNKWLSTLAIIFIGLGMLTIALYYNKLLLSYF